MPYNFINPEIDLDLLFEKGIMVQFIWHCSSSSFISGASGESF